MTAEPASANAASTAARVTARLCWPGGEHVWCWTGDLPADSCVRVGTLQAVVPEAEGPLVLDLELHLPAGEVVTNRYEASIDAA